MLYFLGENIQRKDITGMDSLLAALDMMFVSKMCPMIHHTRRPLRHPLSVARNGDCEVCDILYVIPT